MDFLSLTPTFKCCNLTCLATRHTTWRLVTGESTDVALGALSLFINVRTTPITLILDRAAYFTSPTFTSVCHQRLNIFIEFLTPRSPWTSLFELNHGVGLQAARRAFIGLPKIPKNQDTLDKICTLINNRPLGITVGHDLEMITPEYLAYGSNKRSPFTPMPIEERSVFDSQKNLGAARKILLDSIWLNLKRKSLATIPRQFTSHQKKQLTADDLQIGKHVLVGRTFVVLVIFAGDGITGKTVARPIFLTPPPSPSSRGFHQDLSQYSRISSSNIER